MKKINFMMNERGTAWWMREKLPDEWERGSLMNRRETPWWTKRTPWWMRDTLWWIVDTPWWMRETPWWMWENATHLMDIEMRHENYLMMMSCVREEPNCWKKIWIISSRWILYVLCGLNVMCIMYIMCCVCMCSESWNRLFNTTFFIQFAHLLSF